MASPEEGMGCHVRFRIAVMRRVAMNRLIHLPGLMSVYLRLLEIPVPALCCPSAGEQGM